MAPGRRTLSGLGCSQLLLTALLAWAIPNASALKRQRPGVGSWRRLLGDQKPPLVLAKPDYQIYHHADALLLEVDKIVKAHAHIMTMEVKTAKDLDYESTMKIVTVDSGGPSPAHKDKVRMLLDFGEHSREYISSELGLLLLRTLADPVAAAKVVGGGARGERLLRLLGNVVFKILPLENPRGRALVEGGKLCERKNGRGVDPNRNWSVDWGKKEKDYDPNEENPGREAFSEPEVQMVRNLATSFAPHVWLNVHSGMDAMFTPYDHKAEVPAGAQDALRILQTIHRDVFDSDKACVVGSGGKSVGYLAHGTATDYMFDVLKVPMPFTWEIFGDFKADYTDCFRMFNPITQADVKSVLKRWLLAIFTLVEQLPTHPATPQGFREAAALPKPAALAPAAAAAAHGSPRNSSKTAAVKDAGTGAATGEPKPGKAADKVVKPPSSAAKPAATATAVMRPPLTTTATQAGGEVLLASPPGALAEFERHQMMLNMALGFVSLFIVGFLVARYLRKEAEGAPT